MKTVLEILTRSTEHLQKKNIPNARREAEELIAAALGLPRLEIYLQFDRPLNEPELDECRRFLMRRSQREPIQYICGSVDFYQCKLKVNRSVLIPRQETEILVDKIAQSLTGVDLKGKTLWDVCCGSGCIGLALKKKFPDLHVILSDISPEAIRLAQENARQNEIEVDFKLGDLLSPFEGFMADYVVCNPPYVTEKEYEALDPEVKDHEPKGALVSGPTGLEMYRRLAEALPFFLNKGGQVWLEIGSGQKDGVMTYFSNNNWTKCKVESDWAGHDRFFYAARP